MDFTTYHKSLLVLCIAICALVTVQSPAVNAKSTVPEFGTVLAQSESPANSPDQQDTALQKKRMCLVGAVGGAVVGTILILFGYFRLNHATRGFYAGRLQTLAMVMVVVLLGLAMWFARQFGF